MYRSTQNLYPFVQGTVPAPEVDPPLLRHLYPSAQDAVLSVRESVPLCYSTCTVQCTQAQDAESVKKSAVHFSSSFLLHLYPPA
jgi:hypothetical protein